MKYEEEIDKLKHIKFDVLSCLPLFNKVMTYILNTFPSKFFAEHSVDDFEIHYLHETIEGDLLSVYKKESENSAEFLIKSGDNEVVRAKLTFK